MQTSLLFAKDIIYLLPERYFWGVFILTLNKQLGNLRRRNKDDEVH